MDTRFELYAVEVSSRTQWRNIRLTFADGTVAIGECSDSGALQMSIASLERLVPHLKSALDSLPTSPAAVKGWADAALTLLPTTRSARTVLGGVEQALCDAAARRQNLPVWQWLDGRADGHGKSTAVVPCYANINRVPGGRAPGDVARAAMAAVAAGFSAVKCAPFDVPDERLSLADAGVARLAAVREAVGEDIDLMVDFHLRLSMDEVARILPALHQLNVSWLEDAADVQDVDNLRRLRYLTGVTLAGGEFAHDAAQLSPALDAGLIDVVMPDIKHAGGITGALALASSVPEAVKISLHNPSGPVGTAASAHLFRVLPNATMLELATHEVAWRSASILPPERVCDGHLAIPEGPGLGIELNDHHQNMRLVWSTTF